MKNVALVAGCVAVLGLAFVWLGGSETTSSSKRSLAHKSTAAKLNTSPKTADVEKLFAKQQQTTKRAKELLAAVSLIAEGDSGAEAVVEKFTKRMEPMLLLPGGGYMHLAHNEAPMDEVHMLSRVPFVFIDPEVAGAAAQFPKIAVLFNGSVVLYRTDAPIHEELLSVVLLHAISSWADSEAMEQQKVATPLDTTAQTYANAKVLVSAYGRECNALDRLRNGTLQTEISRVFLDEKLVVPAGYRSYMTPNMSGVQQLQDVIFPYGVRGAYENSLQLGLLFTCVFLQQSNTFDEQVRSFEWLFYADGGANVKRLASAGGAYAK